MDPGIAPACLPGFAALMRGFGEAELARLDGSVYGLWPDLTLGYLNPAWFRFAQENGGADIPARWSLGADVLSATTGPLRAFYERQFARCLEQRARWRHEYECSSVERFRRFHMDVFPLEEGRGLLVVNTLSVEHAHTADRAAQRPVEERYAGADGLIVQCAYCRRVQRPDEPEQWDWVPAWVEHPPANLSGGLCKPCYRLHFPDAPEPE